MAKSRSTKPKPEPEPIDGEPKPPLVERLRGLLFRPKFLFLMALAVSSTVLIPLLTGWLPDLSQRDEYRLFASEIVVTRLPRWVPQDFVEQVVETGGLPPELSVLDEEVTEQVAAAFRLHPWVKEVGQVRKSVPARIEVELIYRQPAAMVEVKQGVYPIDADGVLLPPSDFSIADTRRYPLITNVRSTPQGPAGTSWGDVSVAGAARLAEVLIPFWKEFDLASIQAPRIDRAETQIDELMFHLITNGGSRIIWGRIPGSDHPGELTAEQKLGRLQEYLSDFGGFHQPHGPYEIDIRHWQEISRRPITARRPQGYR